MGSGQSFCMVTFQTQHERQTTIRPHSWVVSQVTAQSCPFHYHSSCFRCSLSLFANKMIAYTFKDAITDFFLNYILGTVFQFYST